MGLLLLAYAVSCLSLQAQTDSVRANAKLPGHPRLLLLAGEEKKLLKTIEADPVRSALHRAILGECDNLLTVAPLERKQIGRRLLSVSREALRRLFFLAYAYRMTGKKDYLTRAEREMLAVSGFSDWNPSHFLDVAEMTMAVAIGYDWLHGNLSETSRKTIREAIRSKGLEPSLVPKHNGWLNATHNWNQVCNAGITFGALATWEDDPAQARTLVNRAVRTIVKPMEDYAPHGAYPEGYSYWGYGTTFNVLFISALEKAIGTDFGLAQQPGFLQTPSYLLHMTGPTGQSFNYSDASEGGGSGPQPAMWWFARKRADPSLLHVERERLAKGDFRPYVKERTLPALLIWGADISLNKATIPPTTAWAGGGKNPVALFRSSWTDPKAIYLGLKAGSPSVNHGHMDVGSFVMEADGVRWAIDLGLQSYESLESKGVKLWGKEQDAQRWEVFRYRNEVHNTLTIDGQLQRADGYAGFNAFVNSEPAFQRATIDMTDVYKGQLQKSLRGGALIDNAYVLIQDELQAMPNRKASVRWSMLTRATVRLTGPGTAKLTQDGRTLTLRVAQPARITLKTWPTTPPHDYDAPNPGTTLVGFEVEVPAGEKAALTVMLVPQGAEGNVRANVKPLAEWPIGK